MSAVTTIVNPASSGEVLQFTVTPELYIILAEKSITAPKSTLATFGAGSASSTGPMLKSSTLASLTLDNLVLVYGVVAQSTSKDSNTAQVALISPVYQPLPDLSTDVVYGRIAATLRPDDDGGYSAFLYYRKPNDLHTIYEYMLTDPDSDQNSYKPNSLGEKTYLTTYYDTVAKARHIVYQDDDNSLHDFNLTTNSRVMIDNAVAAIPTTPLAATWRGETSEVYLYYSVYAHCEYKLRRIIQDKDGNWGSPSFPKAPLMNKTTQMSVTMSKEGCHVFYEGTKSGFQHYIDSWK